MIKLHCLKYKIQGDILSMIEQESDCKDIKLDNKTLIKKWIFDDSD